MRVERLSSSGELQDPGDYLLCIRQMFSYVDKISMHLTICIEGALMIHETLLRLGNLTPYHASS